MHEARGLDVMPSTLHKMRLDPESQALLRVSIFFFFLQYSDEGSSFFFPLNSTCPLSLSLSLFFESLQ